MPLETAPYPSKVAGWMLALSATLFFSMATPIARGMIVGGADPTGIIVYRLMIATGLHAVALALTAPVLLRPKGRGLWLSLGAGLVNGLGMVLYFWSLVRLEASMTAMLLSLSPLVVLSLLALRGEKFTIRHGLRMGLALLGVYLLIGPGGNVDMVGVMMVLGAILAFASQLVVVQWFLQSYDARTITFYTNMGMFIFVAIVWVAQGMPWTPLSPMQWGGVVVLAVFSTFLARWAMYSAISVIGSGQMSLLSPLEILLAVSWSVIFLNESLTLAYLFGGLLILASALLAIQRINLARYRPRWRVWVKT
jgi:drug/metabolite transporter (DMT)-like permease